MEAIEKAKLALRKHILDNKEKIISDLDEMRLKSKGSSIYNYINKLSHSLFKNSIIFDSVRSSKYKLSMRKRQCFKCGGSVKKGECYINHQFRYDYRIITISICRDCF